MNFLNLLTSLILTTHTAGEAGFMVNSHLIAGPTEAVLVDAQFTRSEARKTAEMVKRSGKKLKAIFITHGHPDHYFGLEILKAEFPQAEIIAAAETVNEIKATSAGKLAYWKPIYKDDLTDSVVLPTVYAKPTIEIDGLSVELVNSNPGESENATVLFVRQQSLLLAGDAAYNQVHLWLAENRPNEWLKNLANLKTLGRIETVATGHGTNGTSAVIDENAKYIRAFIDATKLPNAEAKAKLKALYPNFKLPIIADLSVDARVPTKK